MTSEQFRFYRRDDMDDWASRPETPRDDHLRKLVDQLPPLQRHLVSRIFFGGAFVLTAAKEVGIDVRKARRELRDAYATIETKLHKNHNVGPLSAAFLAREHDQPLPVA